MTQTACSTGPHGTVVAELKSHKVAKGGRRNASLPPEAVAYLKNWMLSPEHIAHPYPTEQEKVQIMQETGITLKQLTNWMVNNRKRIWKPRIEAKIQQQAQAAVAAVAVQAQAAALTAVALAQHQAVQNQDRIVSPTTANPVTPEGRFKPTVIMPMPSDDMFVQFNAENSTKHNKLDQLDLFSVQQSLSSEAATKALQAMFLQQQQQQQTNSVAVAKPLDLISEPSTPTSVSMSDEDVSVSAPEHCEDSVVPVSLFERSLDNDNIDKSYTRNVSFSSLEFVSGSCGDQTASSSPVPLLSSPLEATGTNNSNNKRSCSTSPTTPAVIARRKKHRRISLDMMWVDACSKASHIHDENLPSFEEASRLFGFCK